MTLSLIGLGANLGDRVGQMRRALERIRRHPAIDSVAVSRVYESEAVGGPAEQAPYLNAAARFETSLTAPQLLALLHEIEAEAGRVRDQPWGPRPLDLDLLLFGGEVHRGPELQIPHPRLGIRRFAIVPAAEVAADLMHPTLRMRLSRVLERLETSAAYLAIVGAPAAGKTELLRQLVERGDAKGIFDRVDPNLVARLDKKPVTALPAVERILALGRAAKLSAGVWPIRDERGAPSRVDWVGSDFWFGQASAYVAGWSVPGRGAPPESRDDGGDRSLAEQVTAPRMIAWLDAPAEWSAEQVAARRRPDERRMDVAWCARFRAALADRLAVADAPVLTLDAREPQQAVAELVAAMTAARQELRPLQDTLR